jgi:hypothetical protein
MKKRSMRALIIIALLLLAVSCQANTAEPTLTIQEEAPEATPVQPPAGGEPSSSGLRALLEAPTSAPPGKPVKVRFSLINESDSSLYVLNWFTPLEGLGEEIFRVTRNGQRIPYQGPQASRGDPTPDAYTLIASGEMVSVEVDLSLAYDFSWPGEYAIEFVPPRLSHIAGSEEEMAHSAAELGPVEIPSNTVTVAIGAQ